MKCVLQWESGDMNEWSHIFYDEWWMDFLNGDRKGVSRKACHEEMKENNAKYLICKFSEFWLCKIDISSLIN